MISAYSNRTHLLLSSDILCMIVYLIGNEFFFSNFTLFFVKF